MQRNFMINTSPEHARILSGFSDNSTSPNKSVIQLVSKKTRLRPRIDDMVLTLGLNIAPNRDNKYYTDNYSLQSKAKITDVFTYERASFSDLNTREQALFKKARRNNEELIFFKHYLEIEKTGEFKMNQRLEGYKYSLLQISNYGTPHRHFSNKITELGENDYETLLREQVYISRTIFGRLVHMLPKENRLEFVLMAIEEFNTPELREISIIRGLRFLRDYVNERIIKMGEYIIECDNILKEDFLGIINYRAVGFIDAIEKGSLIEFKADNLHQQAELFRKVFEQFEKVDKTIKTVLESYSDINTEKRFQEIFKNRRWPIDLTT